MFVVGVLQEEERKVESKQFSDTPLSPNTDLLSPRRQANKYKQQNSMASRLTFKPVRWVDIYNSVIWKELRDYTSATRAESALFYFVHVQTFSYDVHLKYQSSRSS